MNSRKTCARSVDSFAASRQLSDRAPLQQTLFPPHHSQLRARFRGAPPPAPPFRSPLPLLWPRAHCFSWPRAPRCACQRDETCPISTDGWTRRVHFVREGGRGGRPARARAAPSALPRARRPPQAPCRRGNDSKRAAWRGGESNGAKGRARRRAESNGSKDRPRRAAARSGP